MSTVTKRKYPRDADCAPILYAGYNLNSYSEAMMHNSCFGGMYFETDSLLQPESDLYIKVQKCLKRSFESVPCRDFRAQVKWCRQVTEGKNPRFGMGVHFLARSHLSYGINIENSDCICDYCENKPANGLIHRTESWLFLCLDCLHYMEALPGNQERAVEQFLLGNVI
jgi:hypothetical protein